MIEKIVSIDGTIGNNIGLLFHEWKGKEERVVAISPHDDDLLIGAGLLVCELVASEIDVYLAILTDGKKGYCKEEQKKTIAEIRMKETTKAYSRIGIFPTRIRRFELPDSDLWKEAFKWENEEGKDNGLIARMIRYFREVRATRFLLPNENDFHLDHQAAFRASLYAAIQASEKIVPDFGMPCKRNTILKYGVWSQFKGKPTHGLRTSQDTLNKKILGIESYQSQEQIKGITQELEKRGPYEFFQEHKVESFPAENYKHMFFWGLDQEKLKGGKK